MKNSSQEASTQTLGTTLLQHQCAPDSAILRTCVMKNSPKEESTLRVDSHVDTQVRPLKRPSTMRWSICLGIGPRSVAPGATAGAADLSSLRPVRFYAIWNTER